MTMADLQRLGGYECEFVDVIPVEVQAECPICLHTLKDPHLVDCCGHRFCQVCIETHMLANDSCPLCKQENPNVVIDKQLARILGQKEVRCTHREAGCKWMGELRLLEGHLLSPNERLKGCQFQELKCSFCNSPFQRRQMENHELECPRRVVICEYCHFKYPLEELEKHWQNCDYYPVDCPKGCGEKIKRARAGEHIEKQCSLTLIECRFAHVGCTAQRLRKNMRHHVKESIEDHLSMLEDKYSELEKENEDKKREMEMFIDIIRMGNAQRETIEQKDQVFVENLSFGTTEQMLRSLFGQFGRLHSVKFYSESMNALLKYQDDDSIQNLFRQYNSRGIKLRGSQLKCAHLCY